MGLRPAKCIRGVTKKPWTRFSKCKPKKSYIKSMPHRDLNQYRMGVSKPDYDVCYDFVAKESVTLRDNAIESARTSANKELETKIPESYYFIVRSYPHMVIRENKMVSGAGADRIQKGMRRSFGKPTDRAARIKKGQTLFTIYTYKNHEPLVMKALKKAQNKVSGRFRVVAS